MGRWWVRRLDEIPRIEPEEPHDPDWHPLQHHFGLTAFGINVYVARSANDVLAEEHDEKRLEHEELYYVIAGRARFTLDGEGREAAAGTVVAVPDPAIRRASGCARARHDDRRDRRSPAGAIQVELGPTPLQGRTARRVTPLTIRQ